MGSRGDKPHNSMDYKKGDTVRFDWQLTPKGTKYDLIGEVVDREGENYVIKVVDSNNQVHRFHVLPRQVRGLAN